MTGIRSILVPAVGAGCVAIAAWGAVFAGGAGARVRAPAPRDAIGAIACHQAVDPLSRHVSVRATIRPVPGTRTLQLKFGLTVTVPGAGSAPATATGLGQWLEPTDPTLGQRPGDVWELSKKVYNLGAGSYRYSVSFRWLGAGGKVLKTATLQTSSCVIKELRPDLEVRAVKVTPVVRRPGRDRYVALIANVGGSASGPFAVLFEPGPASRRSETRHVGTLAPGATARVRFTGPVCNPAAPPSVTADPRGEIDDADRSNNTLTVACPAA